MTRHADEVTFCLTLTTPLEMSFGGSSSGASYNTSYLFFSFTVPGVRTRLISFLKPSLEMVVVYVVRYLEPFYALRFSHPPFCIIVAAIF